MEYDINEEEIRIHMRDVLSLCKKSTTSAGEAAIRNDIAQTVFYSGSSQNSMLTLLYYQNMLINNELKRIKSELRELRGI